MLSPLEEAAARLNKLGLVEWEFVPNNHIFLSIKRRPAKIEPGSNIAPFVQVMQSREQQVAARTLDKIVEVLQNHGLFVEPNSGVTVSQKAGSIDFTLDAIDMNTLRDMTKDFDVHAALKKSAHAR